MMALSNLPSRSPLGAPYRSPLGALTRGDTALPGVLTLVLANEAGRGYCHWFESNERNQGTQGWYYPNNDAFWDTRLASINDALDSDVFSYTAGGVEKSYYFKAGLMSFGPTPILGSPAGYGNSYGLAYCKPTSKSYPSWLYTTEHAVGGDYSSCNASITLADLKSFFTNSIGAYGSDITHVRFVLDDSPSMCWAKPRIGLPNYYYCFQKIISRYDGAWPAFEAWITGQGYIVDYDTLTLSDPYDEDWLYHIFNSAFQHYSRV